MTSHRAAFLLLALNLSLLTLAGRADDLSVQLKQGVEIQQQLGKLHVQMQEVGKQVIAGFQAYLPKGESPYAALTWESRYSDGAVRYIVKDANQRRLFQVQVYYHPDGVDPKTRGMQATALDYPALRVMNQSLSVLVGKVELQLRPVDDTYKNDEKLLDLLGSFDLEGLKKL